MKVTPSAMNDEITIRIIDVVGDSVWVSAKDGDAVHDKIAPLLREGRKVALSFEGAESIISAFLNSAVGQFYGEFPEELIRKLLSVRDATSADLLLLKRVVDNAKVFFRDPERYSKVVTPLSEDDDEE
jgi:STAS-like domain of unknown function (DUF4325)